jgi:hypothetical protein
MSFILSIDRPPVYTFLESMTFGKPVSSLSFCFPFSVLAGALRFSGSTSLHELQVGEEANY